MKLLTRFTLLALALFGLVGCATHGPVNSIAINLIDARPISATALETQVALSIRFSNENVIPIAIEGSVHKVYINGTYVGKAMSDKPVGLPPMKTVADTVTLYMENTALAKELLRFANQPNATYKIESKLTILSGEEKITVKTTNDGSIDLSALLK